MGNCQCRKYYDSEQESSNNNLQEIILDINQKQEKVQELFIKIKTQRQESFSLFDYENQNHQKESILKIREGGYLIKNNNELQWIDEDIDWNKCVIKQEQILFRIEKLMEFLRQQIKRENQELTTKNIGDNREFQQSENLDQFEGKEFEQSQELIKMSYQYQKLSQSQKTNPKVLEKGSKLWLVVRSIQQKFKNTGIKLKQGDLLKFGRVKFKISEIQLNNRELLRDSDSGGLSQSDSILCRICCSSSDSLQNPLINPCKCTGSIKYIHLNCLKKWLKLKFQTKHSNHCMIYMWKDLECEICKFNYPPIFKSDEHHFDLIELSKPIDQNYVLMEIIQNHRQDARNNQTIQDQNWTQCNGVYIITFNNNGDDKTIKTNQLQIGRANEMEIKINDISVSRNHGILKLYNGKLYLMDNRSKFGSLILIKQKVIPLIQELNGIEIQLGRSVVQFNFGKDELNAQSSKQVLDSENLEKIIGPDPEDEDLLYFQ